MAPSLSKSGPDEMGCIDGNNSSATSTITLQGTEFLANGHPILTHVPPNIVATASPFFMSPPSSAQNDTKPNNMTVGCFVGFDADFPRSRHVASLGKLTETRFMSIFRFKVWWTTHWAGSNGGDLETETQMMILDKNDDGSRPYVLILPTLEGPFQASLQAGSNDHVDVCVESGSTRVVSSRFRSCVYMHVGDDPYGLVNEAMRVVKVHLGTFRLMEEKNPPRIVDKFGWCTWDAFYLKVHPKGVWEGVRGLSEGGTPPGMVLIDDGWQSIAHDEDSISDDQEGMNRTAAGGQMPCRLIRFEENQKFRDYVSPKCGTRKGMGGFVRDLKEEFGTVEDVYVWHALCGYWGGIRPGVKGMPESKVVRPKLSKGLEATMEDLAVDKIVSNGVGLVPPEMAHRMYEGLHSHLESAGIDGVKVDVIQADKNSLVSTTCVMSFSCPKLVSVGEYKDVLINLLEMVSEDYGGRVELAKAYYKALTASLRKHFKGNGVIASMEHCNDFMLLGTEAIALGRVGDDFWCVDPSGDPNGTFWLQGCHMVHCAYNSLWMGNFIHPDWDMFQSTHPCAEFHAASRAISGGPIYVSDSVGNHNFKLLKSLALPDGSILRCQHYALPTRDCLFEDPLHDGKTMLKIWNLNKYTGVLGLFNCQGGGWCPESRQNKSASQFSHLVTCSASPKDVEWKAGRNPVPIEGVNAFAVYMFREKKLKLLNATESIEVSLEPFCFELLTVSPLMVLPTKLVQFAAIGLVSMLNTGGAIRSLEVDDDESKVKIGVRGCGEMKLFASEKPVDCEIDGVSAKFGYEDMMVSVQVPWPHSSRESIVEYLF